MLLLNQSKRFCLNEYSLSVDENNENDLRSTKSRGMEWIHLDDLEHFVCHTTESIAESIKYLIESSPYNRRERRFRRMHHLSHSIRWCHWTTNWHWEWTNWWLGRDHWRLRETHWTHRWHGNHWIHWIRLNNRLISNDCRGLKRNENE